MSISAMNYFEEIKHSKHNMGVSGAGSSVTRGFEKGGVEKWGLDQIFSELSLVA